MAFISRWKPAHEEPKGPFVLNKDSPQANGLVFWMPCHPIFGVDASNSAKFDHSLVHRGGSVLGTNAMSFGRFNDGTTGFSLTDGSLSGLSFAEDDGLNMDGASRMSMMCRFNTPSVGSTDTIFGRPFQSDHGGRFWQYALIQRSNNEFMFFTSNGSTFNRGNHGSISADTDYHFAGTFNSDEATEKRIYVDGVEIGSNSFDGVMSTATSATPLRIGSNASDGERWDGIIADLRVYKRTLSAAEVFLAHDPATRFDLYHELGRRIHFFLGLGGGVIAIGQAQETDTAHPVTVQAGAVSVAVGQAAEADTAFGVTISSGSTISVGLAQETDAAFPVTLVAGAISIVVGQALETDTALGITTVGGGDAIALGLAIESDTALPITLALGGAAVPIGLALETDTAHALFIARSSGIWLHQPEPAAVWNNQADPSGVWTPQSDPSDVWTKQ